MKNDLLEILHKESGDFLLLENCDHHAFLHNNQTQLCALTEFTGSAGEAVLSKNGEIFLFVDSRYHIQADAEAAEGVSVIKVPMREAFLESIKRIIPKTATVVADCNISLNKFRKFQKNFKNVFGVELPKNPINISNKPLWEVNGTSFKQKIKRIAGDVPLFVTGLDEIAWLTNLRGADFEFSTQFISKMLVESDSAILFTDHNVPKIEGLEVQPYANYKKALLKREKVSYCPSSITYCDFSLIKNPVEIKQNKIVKLMSIKNAREIEHLKFCFARLDKSLGAFRAKIKSGLSEFQLKEILENEIISAGAQSLSFKTILAIGDNSASIHYSSYDPQKKLKEGDLILLDCGGYYEDGYATDITRVFVCGKPSALQKKVYTTVLKAFFMAYKMNETSTLAIDLSVREFLKTISPKGFEFAHSLGHGLGINVHQSPPTLSPNTPRAQKLKKGMVFTIEPGLYCENKFGVRLENTVFVDTDGVKKSFSHFQFENSLIDEKLLTKQEKIWLKEWQNGRD